MTTQTTDARIATRRAALTTQRAERKDDLDLPRTMTQREVNAYLAETGALDRKIAAFNTAVETWAALPTPDADTTWLAHLTTWRATCSAELLAIKSPIRDKDTKERADRLTFSIRLIDFGLGISTIGPIISLSSLRVGELMREAGYATEGPALRGPNGFRGPIKEVEARIKTLTKQRAEAQAALDAVLLTDDERTTQEAESAQLREAFNRLHVRGSADGLGYVVVDEDGAPRDLATLTPIERQAFDRMDTLERKLRQDTFERQLGRG